MSPLTKEGPVLVIVVPAKTANPVAFPSPTTGSAAPAGAIPEIVATTVIVNNNPAAANIRRPRIPVNRAIIGTLGAS
jgi:hypothetical protein